MRSILTTTVILSLLALVFCGMGMMCFDQLTHYAFLANSVPVQTFFLSIVIATLFMVALLAELNDTFRFSSGARLFKQLPDLTVWPPLQLAFADGILNTKAF